MYTRVENILIMVAAVPGLYGFLCWIRRSINAHKAARWVKDNYREEWNGMHWLAQRNNWAGVEVLISNGVISGPEVDAYRERDEYLEKATWVGLLVSAMLVLVIVLLKLVVSAAG